MFSFEECGALTEMFAVTRKLLQTFCLIVTVFGQQRVFANYICIIKLPFGTTKVAAYANKRVVCEFVTNNMEMFTKLILYSSFSYKVDNY